MNAIEFEDANVRVAENQEEYLTLPALRFNDDNGTMITCWKLPFKERVKLLFTGIIWMSELTFGSPITPRYFSLDRKEVYTKPSDNA